jgi:hypothetical protein
MTTQKQKTNKLTGFILSEFRSPIDGNLCTAILTLKSSNRKTGNMAQVWILRQDINPVDAIATGDDESICGNCSHRKNDQGERSCYVNVGQSPNSIWKAYKRGIYPHMTEDVDRFAKAVEGRSIRWGAYGDPAIIPSGVFTWVMAQKIKNHTGYTHQWRQPFAEFYKGFFQASCDGLQDYLDATAHGWKTFAVAPVGSTLPGKLCPATAENSQAECITCRLCDGAKQNIFVEAHGTGKKYIKGAN